MSGSAAALEPWRVALVQPHREGEEPAVTLEALTAALPPSATIVALGDPARSPVALAEEAVARGANLLVVSGGDGSVSGAASVIIGRADIALAIVPTGTSNSIGGHFGITSLAEALAVLEDPRPRAIDTARVNGKPMLLMATLGVHADAVLGADRGAKASFGVLAYAYEELRRVFDHEKLEAELWVDDIHFRVSASAITIANLGPTKSVLVHGAGGPIEDDGLLDLTVVDYAGLTDGVATMLRLAQNAGEGSAAPMDNVVGMRGRKIRVQLSVPRQLMVDGEDAGTGELTAEIVPQSLQLLVPEAYGR